MTKKTSDYTDAEILNAVGKYGSGRKAAKALNLPRTTLRDRIRRIKEEQFTSIKPDSEINVTLPNKGEPAKVFIFSAAQNNTEVDKKFLKNLKAYAKHRNAKIHVSGFTYTQAAFDGKSRSPGEFHPDVREYMTNKRLNIADRVLFCGEMNTSPTAVTPLSGMETYTRDKWGIFPHPKVQLDSVPTMKNSPPKVIMTTGSITKSNYIQKKAGIKAEFHHIIGAVVLEVDSDGAFFCRHLIADHDGSFQDLTTFVRDGKVSEGPPVTVITYGDIHNEYLDPDVAETVWGVGGLTETLRPQNAFIHDAIDFSRRNYHNVGDPHFRFKQFSENRESVREEVENVGCFLLKIARAIPHVYVVASNHDAQLMRWLKNADYRSDPVNAEFFLEAQLRLYQAISDGDNDFDIFEWAVKKAKQSIENSNIHFLREDDSLMLLGIENGAHGHLGANGSRATPRQFTKMGPKTNTAHTHSCSIIDGSYTAGTCSKLDMGYNKGPSSWSHSHILTYANGKRTIVTHCGNKWRCK